MAAQANIAEVESSVFTWPLNSVGVLPTANLWPDWSPQKRVNRDKLDQRQMSCVYGRARIYKGDWFM